MTTKRVRIRDRRMTPRYHVTLDATIVRPAGVVMGAGTGPFSGRCLDISQTGLRFFSEELFGRRERIEITVFNGEGVAALKVLLEVVRAQKVTGGYQIGGRFLETLSLK